MYTYLTVDLMTKYNNYVIVLYFLGLETCANEIPFRYLVKQLLVEKNRVIFTGSYILT